ncbi:MAG: DUF1501 domain-containing protein [Planctomycetaceae bacterium]|nr:DUF1501 domain-containing protein [Planctomycetaceae bacterium]
MSASFPHSLRSIRRRECLQIGSSGLLGLSLGQLVKLKALQASNPTHAPAQRAQSCLFVFLFGGPSHIDLWDMKPQAPAEIRGEFQPISTRVPGVSICEHLPQLAKCLDHFCLLRSMTHGMNVHGPACSEVYSGRPYFGPPVTDQATPQDWPSLASLVSRFGSSSADLPPSIVLPAWSHFVGQTKRIAGQSGGRMGEQWNPLLIEGNPQQADFEVPGLNLPEDVSLQRLQLRQRLRESLNSVDQDVFRAVPSANQLDSHYAAATELIQRSQSANVFAIEQETAAVRQRYGMTKFGQSLLLARRVVEAGVPLVTVNWEDESRFDKVSPQWDTHHHNFTKLKDNLCPVFDQAFSALIEDLAQRGLLESTLVVALGEFGRTPKIGVITQNNMTEKTGRDHWPHAFTALIAGGGVRGGQVYGATTENGGYVADQPVTPADLCATVLHHLGIDPGLTYDDQFQNVSRVLSEGRVVTDLK